MNDKVKIKNYEERAFCCSHCLTELGTRQGDVMISPTFTVEFKHRHRILCAGCGRYTTFSVNGQGKKFDKAIIIN